MQNSFSRKHLPIDDYKNLMMRSPICTVDVIYLDSTRENLLLGKRCNEPYRDIFYTFGGRIQKDESFEDTACRVAKEETGVDLDQKQLRFIGVINENNDNSIFENTNYHAITLCFEYILSKDVEIKLDPQHSEYRWISISDQNLHPNIKVRVEMALGDKPVLR